MTSLRAGNRQRIAQPARPRLSAQGENVAANDATTPVKTFRQQRQGVRLGVGDPRELLGGQLPARATSAARLSGFVVPRACCSAAVAA
jgi:hypothetical protein